MNKIEYTSIENLEVLNDQLRLYPVNSNVELLKSSKFKAIDLYSGIGGWTLGMKMSGIQNISSYEWWTEANLTHNLNFNTNTENVDIRGLAMIDLPEPESIDFVVGSPPCTQFSYANRGGKGDIVDGLKDIYKFLEVVEYLKPKYWAMENVPRVAKIIEKEIQEDGVLAKFRDLFEIITVVSSDDFGVPQARKRMIAGRFPSDLFFSYKNRISKRTLGDVLSSVKGDEIIDPIYNYKLPRSAVSGLELEEPLNKEEERINCDSKTFHPVYNKMSFPEDLNRPSRTITALCTRVSRESLIIPDERYKGEKYRRLTIRERAMLQSFPITFQFYGKSFASNAKMIGNAIPPLLTYYIFQSMLETPSDKILPPSKSNYTHKIPEKLPGKTKMDTNGKKFAKNRNFKFAIPNLRFGSGVRFDFSNHINSSTNWRVGFFYGNSKSTESVDLNAEKYSLVYNQVDADAKRFIDEQLLFLKEVIKKTNSRDLQASWTHVNEGVNPFELVDNMGEVANVLTDYFDKYDARKITEILREIIKLEKNKKLVDVTSYLISGILIGSYVNMNLK
jgi:DNA (cytosine-5)-methyltransferase 1